jgi:mono/diheme cytochrome c family protein
MKRWMKWVGYGVGGILVVLVISAAGVYGASEMRYRKTYTLSENAVAVPTDSAARARGEHIFKSFGGCVDCHGENLGGKPVFEVPALGMVYALNLTTGKGGIGGSRSDAELARAIRHGISASGRPLKVMPSTDYMPLSDEDLGAIIAFIRSRPPVDHEVPPSKVGPVGRALFLANKLPILSAERIDHSLAHVSSVTPAATADYGKYVASVGCMGCHGPALAGGKILAGDPSWPPAANLTPAGSTKDWSEADFRRLIREGKRPNGTPVNEAMPWRVMKNMTDDEIKALYLYTRSLPPTATPGVQTASR